MQQVLDNKFLKAGKQQIAKTQRIEVEEEILIEMEEQPLDGRVPGNAEQLAVVNREELAPAVNGGRGRKEKN